MPHRVGGAGVQTPAAGFADTDLLGDRRIGLDRRLCQHGGQIYPRAEFRRQNIHFKPHRPEARFYPEMTGTELGITAALVIPVRFLRRRDEGRMSECLQPVRDPIGTFVDFPQYEIVDVLHRHAGLGPERPGRDALCDYNNAFGIG